MNSCGDNRGASSLKPSLIGPATAETKHAYPETQSLGTWAPLGISSHYLLQFKFLEGRDHPLLVHISLRASTEPVSCHIMELHWTMYPINPRAPNESWIQLLTQFRKTTHPPRQITLRLGERSQTPALRTGDWNAFHFEKQSPGF